MTADLSALIARLTPAQKQIVGLIPTAYGNDIHRTKGKTGVAHPNAWKVCKELCALGLADVDESEAPLFAGPPHHIGFGWVSLTPLGQQVRARLIEQESADAGR